MPTILTEIERNNELLKLFKNDWKMVEGRDAAVTNELAKELASSIEAILQS